MTEKFLFKEAKKILDKLNYATWFTHKTKYYPKTDIFGAFDMVYLYQDGTPAFVQITTMGHKTDREKKIAEIFKGRTYPAYSYVWAYDSKQKTFKVFKLQK